MYVQRLKTKYKEILSSSRVESEPKETTESAKHPQPDKKHSHMRVLTEYNENTCQPRIVSSSSAYVLALKERIAQATHNLQQKENEVSSLKEEVVRKDEQLRLLEQQMNQGRVAFETSEQKVVQEKVMAGGLEKEIERLKQQIEAIALDRQLVIKQAEYYKTETSKMAKERHTQQKVIDSFHKKTQQFEVLRQQNAHLKDDIKRMQQIVNQMCQKRISTDVSDKHYLGKPMKEASMWFSQNLMGEVEHFLKKEQVGLGSKRFLNNLVKFITKYTSTVKSSKTTSSTNSRVKASGKTSHCRSVSMYDPDYCSTMDIGTSNIKKTQGFGMSALKKSLLISKYKKIDSRKYTSDSLFIPENDYGSICSQLLKQFRGMLKETLKQKQPRPKLILALADEMSLALMRLFESNTS